MRKILLTLAAAAALMGGGHPTLSLEKLSAIQPGMGTVMMEYGHRFWTLYYAAKAGNWDLAAYQLHEQLEIQEVGEATRPKYAAKLKAFEATHLAKLEKAIEAKEIKAFERAYADATRACNRCHEETGHGYIHFTLPATPPPMLRMETK
jgi:cytochrome c553